jgi:hypothetical protein
MAEVTLTTMNRVQFQPGLSLAGFLDQFGTEAACVAMVPPGRRGRPMLPFGLDPDRAGQQVSLFPFASE